jgi:hypothetical protein
MKYAIGMGSGVVIYIPSVIKIDSPVQKLLGWDTHAHIQHGDHISILSFFQS